MEIHKGDSDYETLLINWHREGEPRRFQALHKTWRVVKDNGEMYFLQVASVGINEKYGDLSTR